MLRLSRWQLGAMAMGYGLYHAFLGLVSLGEYREPMLVYWALLIYLLTLIAIVIDKPGLKLRPLTAFVAVAIALVIPLLVFDALGEVRQSSYATWHIAAVGTVLAIVAIRQFPKAAWMGTVVVTLEVLQWGGTDVIFNSGLIGTWVLVSVGHAASIALQNSERSAAEFRNRAFSLDTAAAASSAARAERTQRLRETLSEVLPLMRKIVRSAGELSEKDRVAALLKESELRDQIRGRNLLTEDVVKATRAARRRGVEVQLLDDGGLDDLDARSRLPYLQEVAQRLAKIKAGKVVVRASQGDGWRVTMAAIRKEADRPDLFIRL